MFCFLFHFKLFPMLLTFHWTVNRHIKKAPACFELLVLKEEEIQNTESLFKYWNVQDEGRHPLILPSSPSSKEKLHAYISYDLYSCDLNDWILFFPENYNVISISTQTPQRIWNFSKSLCTFMHKGYDSDLTIWVYKSEDMLLRPMN